MANVKPANAQTLADKLLLLADVLGMKDRFEYLPQQDWNGDQSVLVFHAYAGGGIESLTNDMERINEIVNVDQKIASHAKRHEGDVLLIKPVPGLEATLDGLIATAKESAAATRDKALETIQKAGLDIALDDFAHAVDKEAAAETLGNHIVAMQNLAVQLGVKHGVNRVLNRPQTATAASK